jgi:hypothetical protein
VFRARPARLEHRPDTAGERHIEESLRQLRGLATETGRVRLRQLRVYSILALQAGLAAALAWWAA